MLHPIPKISEHDEVIGETTIEEAVENGWLRRVARIFVFDNEGNMLLQKRSTAMFTYSGLWDQSAAGHVDIGETYDEAANRELYEELGLRLDLIEIATSYRNVETFESIYKATCEQTVPINFDPHEVSEVKWMSLADFESDYETNPDIYVPPFVSVYKTFRDKLLA